MHITKRLITIDAVSWTALTIPVACNNITIRNPSAVSIYLRTDSADPLTQDTLLSGLSEEMNAPPSSQGFLSGASSARFPASTPLMYAKSSSGTVDVLVSALS